jgi:putative endonuclease
MAEHNDFGKKGEALAAEWLTQKGYRIIHRNWRHGRYEVDIIARFGDIYHFIEVKSGQAGEGRAIPAHGFPEEKVSNQKIRNLMRGASAWLHQFPGDKRVQYDVLSITIGAGGDPQYFLIGDVYVH